MEGHGFSTREGRPFEQTALALLHSQILEEYCLGYDSLPASDHYHFSHCLLSLLSRSHEYKKAWYLNVTAARDMQLRRQAPEDAAHATQEAADGAVKEASMTNSRLVQWIRTGCLR
jgi:hypothetical protein